MLRSLSIARMQTSGREDPMFVPDLISRPGTPAGVDAFTEARRPGRFPGDKHPSALRGLRLYPARCAAGLVGHGLYFARRLPAT